MHMIELFSKNDTRYVIYNWLIC